MVSNSIDPKANIPYDKEGHTFGLMSQQQKKECEQIPLDMDFSDNTDTTP